MIGLWLLLGATPVLDDARLERLETESADRLRFLASGCHRMTLDVEQRDRIGAIRRSTTRWQAEAVLREGTWRFLSWRRDDAPGDLSGYNDWPFVQPGAGRHPGRSDALMRFLSSFSVPSALVSAEDGGGGTRLDQVLLLTQGAREATLELETWFAPETDRAVRWAGSVDGLLPYGDAPLDGLHWTFEVTPDGVPVHETFRTRVRLSTTTVVIRSRTTFTDLGPC